MIRSHQSDKAKDVRFAMFEVFGENRLTYINTTVEQNDIQVFKNSHDKKSIQMPNWWRSQSSLCWCNYEKSMGKEKDFKKDMAFTLAKHPKISVSDNALWSRYEKYWVIIF